MSVQFGIGLLYGGPANSEMEFGCVQGVTLDFSFDKAMLHCGSALYPKDVRIHSASITGRAQFAEIDAEAIYKLLGGDSYAAGNKTITLKNDTKPAAFRIRFLTTTDGVSLIFTLNNCITDSLAWNFGRTDYVIPDFSFTAFADANDVVGTIDLGDPS
jgi:hypothetical protein